MLENSIFHFIIVLFILCAFVWWLHTKYKYNQLKNIIIPYLLHTNGAVARSLAVRTIKCLEEELTTKFQYKVKIIHTFKQSGNKDFLIFLCYLIWNMDNHNKYFTNGINMYSSVELISYINVKKKIEKINFTYDFKTCLWHVEVLHAI